MFKGFNWRIPGADAINIIKHFDWLKWLGDLMQPIRMLYFSVATLKFGYDIVSRTR